MRWFWPTKERILQIGNNLLSNAIKFTDNGSVSLAADYDNGLLKLIVEDTGTGMTEDEQQRYSVHLNVFQMPPQRRLQLGFLQPAVIQQPG